MITIFGVNGFIGSCLARTLDERGIPYFAYKKGDDLKGKNFDNVIYCVGLTSDFRQRPLDTVEAHVCKVLEILRTASFSSFLYLSSTRVYGMASSCESDAVQVNPEDFSDLYNLSKLMGEALLHSSGKNVKVARLSNIYGRDFKSDNFLSAVIRQAVNDGLITLETSLDSEKDYLSIDAAVTALLNIALHGRQKVYNVASGQNVSNHEIVERLSVLTGCRVEARLGAVAVKFPLMGVERLRSEFDWKPPSLIQDLENLTRDYQIYLENKNDTH